MVQLCEGGIRDSRARVIGGLFCSEKEVKTLNSSCCLTEYYSNFTNIKKLRIYLDSNLPWEEQSLWHTPSLNGLSTLDRLTHLQIACGPKSDQNLQALSKCNNLVELALGKLESLKSLSGLEECGKLQIIELSECTVLENIDRSDMSESTK